MSAGQVEPPAPNLPVSRDGAQAPRSYRASVIKRRTEPQPSRPEVRAIGGRVRPATARRKVDPAEELRKETLARVAAEREAIARIDRMTLAWNEELASTVPSLSTVVSRAVASIVGEAPREEVVHNALRRELARVRTERAPVLRVSARDDAEENGWVRRLRSKGEGGSTTFEVKADEAIADGRCILELGARRVELSPETQLATFDDAVRAQAGKLKPRPVPPLPDVEVDEVPDLSGEMARSEPEQPRHRSTVRVRPRRSEAQQEQGNAQAAVEAPLPARRRAVLRRRVEVPVPTPVVDDPKPIESSVNRIPAAQSEASSEEARTAKSTTLPKPVLDVASAPSPSFAVASSSSREPSNSASERTNEETAEAHQVASAEAVGVQTAPNDGEVVADVVEATSINEAGAVSFEGAISVGEEPNVSDSPLPATAESVATVIDPAEERELEPQDVQGSEAIPALSGLAAVEAFNARRNALENEAGSSSTSSVEIEADAIREREAPEPEAAATEDEGNSRIIDVEAEPMDEVVADKPYALAERADMGEATPDPFSDFDALELGENAARFEAAPPDLHPDRPWGDGPATIIASETGDATGSQAVAELRDRVSRTAAVLRQGNVEWNGEDLADDEAQANDRLANRSPVDDTPVFEAPSLSEEDNLPRFRYASRDEAAAAGENAGDAVRQAIAERSDATRPSSDAVRAMRERLASDRDDAKVDEAPSKSGRLSLPPRIAKLIGDVRRS